MLYNITNMDLMKNEHFIRIKEVVSEDIWERIVVLQPKNRVEFSQIFGMGPKTLELIEDEIIAIEKEFRAEKHSDLKPELKIRMEILRDRLINISQRNNIIWNSKEQANKLIDLSKLSQSTIEEIYKLVESPRKKVELKIDGMNNDDAKKVFVSLFRENERQKMEKGRSILFITPAIFLGKTRVEEKDIKLRAPLFLFPVEIVLDKSKDVWILTIDKTRDIITNPFIERYILKEISEFEYNTEVNLEENINRILMYIKRAKNLHGNLESFERMTVKDTWPYMNGEYAVTNNLLLGLFSDFSNEIEAELDHLIYHMDSTPMLSRFLSNIDFHSRDEIANVRKKIETKINNDSELTYTNKLNEQQLRAVKAINNEGVDGLTIWGPPGTGKSETIISIIENAISKGQRVAVVSEKQAALDVIQSRLNIIRRNSIMISDTKDKLSFFAQVSKMLERELYQKENIPHSVKNDLRKKYQELDLLYKKFGFNNKNIFDQVEEIFHSPLYETQLSKRMQYEDQFYNFDNITLESFNQAISFIDSIEDRDRLKLLITVSNNYYGKFKDFEDIKDKISIRIRAEVEYTRLKQELIMMAPEFRMKLESFKGLGGLFKKMSYKKNLRKNYRVKKDDFNDIQFGTYENILRRKIQESNDRKDSLISELEWVEARRIDVDACLSMDVNSLNLIRLIDIDDIQKTKEAIKLNLIKLLLGSEDFAPRLNILREYDSKIEEIQMMQSKFTDLSRDEVIDSLNDSLHSASINKRENNIGKIASSKRPMAIRKFLNEYSIEMNGLVKVWLLQPETIPALFSLDDRFDLVIFDEASQIFLERSLPAIARAEKVVVLGDEKQLGPSSFFAGRISSEENEDEILEENESLLTYSRSKLPEIMLKKHYRSKDVNLIKFSSDRYYEGGLDFINDNNYSGESLAYHFVADSDYHDGQNKAEAKKVIEILQDFKDNGSSESIGVITANSKQEIYIFNQLITKHFELFEWLKENDAFIKSIENVQGDERDVIILSTTYGPEDGNQRINFGPINQALGSNRINVAVTRSKNKMIVVSSIDLEQASQKVQSSLHQGPRDFIEYITYVKKAFEESKSNDIMKSNESFDSLFKSEVYREASILAKKYGLRIIPNYEGLGYTLDLVLQDPNTKKNLCAFLLDAPKNDKLAREKNYLAQEFLESRGWKIFRVWSPNWWNNTIKELTIIDEIIKSYSQPVDSGVNNTNGVINETQFN